MSTDRTPKPPASMIGIADLLAREDIVLHLVDDRTTGKPCLLVRHVKGIETRPVLLKIGHNKAVPVAINLAV